MMLMMISTTTSHIRLIVVFLSLLSIVIFAVNESGKYNNDNSNGNDNTFQLLKINYNDIQDKSSRQNVIDVLKSSLSREGNDDYNYYIYIIIFIYNLLYLYIV
jgi:hypothetical protein